MANAKPRVRVPSTAKAGEVITIKTLISHPMETGLRKDKTTGAPIPRDIINAFTASFNGEPVVSVTLAPAVSANPYFEFQMTVPKSGTVHFEWVDDDGEVYKLDKAITVK